MNLKYILQQFLMFILTSTLASVLWADLSYARAYDTHKIFIGTTSESSPYIMHDSDRQGFDTDLLTAIFNRLGYEVEFLHDPANRLPALLKNKKIDVMATWLNPLWKCHKSEPYRYWQNAILTTDNRDSAIKSPRDLKGKIVGAYPGADINAPQELGVYVETFADYFEVPSSEHAAKMMLSNRFDAYIGDVWAVSHFYDIEVKKQTKQPKLLVKYLFKPNPQILCFDNIALRDRFEEELALFKANGEYEALKIKYIPNVESLK